VVIRRSSAPEVAALLEDLERGDATARQAAAARLAVIGTRAVEGILRVLRRAADPSVQAAAFSALEGTGDARAIDPAFAAIEGKAANPEVAAAAVAVLKAFLDSDRGTEVLDRLTLAALDPARPARTRLAAMEVLRAVPAAVTAPLWARLRKDRDVLVREAVEGEGGPAAGAPADAEGPAEALAAAASSGELPPPDLLRRWLAAGGGATPLPVLHRLVEALRERERAAGEGARASWMTARAAVHLALAGHGSTVALYDLRETIERGEPVPVEMLTAIERVGDRSCLEPLAAAYAKSAAEGRGGWWPEHLLDAFRVVADREGLTPRHAEARRIRSRWPDAAAVLLSRPRHE